MISISTIWFVALLLVSLAVMFVGTIVAMAAGQASSGGHEGLSNRGCLATLFGIGGVICAIVGLFGGFS